MKKRTRKYVCSKKKILTNEKIKKGEEIIVLEKVDGTNISIMKINNDLYGVVKSGYDVRQ